MSCGRRKPCLRAQCELGEASERERCLSPCSDSLGDGNWPRNTRRRPREALGHCPSVDPMVCFICDEFLLPSPQCPAALSVWIWCVGPLPDHRAQRSTTGHRMALYKLMRSGPESGVSATILTGSMCSPFSAWVPAYRKLWVTRGEACPALAANHG